MTRTVFQVVVAFLLLSLGCSSGPRDESAVTTFFEKGSKVGSSPDAGLFKYNTLGEWEHVATFHGMYED